ncbi:MAG: NADH dehydrogenase [Thaumarchaeota archaeon]|nr:MAG: NADH dehydrogenase [Nitrososphaerota archaeon]
MAIPYLLLQTIVVPLIAAAVTYPLGRRLGRRVGWVSFAALLYTSVLLLLAGIEIFNTGAPIREEYAWAAIIGLKFGFLADNLSLPVALVMNAVVAATSVYSMPYMKHRLEAMFGKERADQYPLYFVNYLLFAVGLAGVALSTNLIELYVFVELVLIPSYLLIGLFGYVDKERIALMYFIWNHVGAFLFLAGILIVYFTSGSFNIEDMASIARNPLAFWAVLLILVGWLFKMATFGFHVWLPWAHGEHPTSIAAIIAIIVGLGNYVIVRLLVAQLFSVFRLFGLPLMVLAVVTMFYAGYSTMVQDDVKRLYAWSTIGQTAYSLLGIGSLTVLGITGGVFYFVSHIIGKCILFSTAGILLSQTGTRDIREMGGLAKRMPVTAIIALSGTLILSAVPPLSGFQAEWIMFVGIFTQGSIGSLAYGVVAVFGMIATLFTVAYTFWPIRRIFFGPISSAMEGVKEAPLTMTAPLLSLAAISIIIGVYPESVTRFLYPYVSGLPVLGG